MTITLPLIPNGEPSGSVLLGTLPPGKDDVDISIPLGDFANGWNLAGDSVTLEGNASLHLDLKDVLVFPEPSFPGFMFPRDITDALFEALNATDRYMLGRAFDCSYRGQLPNMTFDFSGTSVVFIEDEYTRHGWRGDDEICLLMIIEPELDSPTLAMGTPLFEKFHVVFDMDKDELGRKLHLAATTSLALC